MGPTTVLQKVLLISLLVLFSIIQAGIVSAGTNVWTSIGPEGGNINALSIDPATPATLYAATGGGVFKSINGGGDWTAVNTDLTNTDVRALAINPQTPATLYAGTGGGGVFKSINGGGNWTAVNTDLTNTIVRALAINPQTPATLYAGTGGGGVFKSINGGGNWTAVNTDLTNTYVPALAINPQTPAALYAATGGGVFKSTNGGGNWTAVYAGFSDPSLVFYGAKGLVIDPATPDTLYAIITYVSSPVVRFFDSVIKSTNGGGDWSIVYPSTSNRDVTALAIDPATPATLYAGTYGGGVFKSTNGGGNWAAFNTGLTNKFVSALAINPPNLYAGTIGGGVFAIQQVPQGMPHQVHLPIILR
jgi:photosystem II stability/assembly factor-like uncharacterized protein